jgi:hypothetical protein
MVIDHPAMADAFVGAIMRPSLLNISEYRKTVADAALSDRQRLEAARQPLIIGIHKS